MDGGVEVDVFNRKVVEATSELRSGKQGEAARVAVPPRTLASTSERGVNETLLSRCFRLLGFFVPLRSHFCLRKPRNGCNFDAQLQQSAIVLPPSSSSFSPLHSLYFSLLSWRSLPSLLLSSVFLPSFTVVSAEEGNSRRRRRRGCFSSPPFMCLYLLTCSFPPPSHVSWAASS